MSTRPENRRRTRRLGWRRKLAFSAIAVVIFFVGFEFVLMLAGVKPLRESRELSFGIAPKVQLFEAVEERYQTRETRLTYFQRQSFAVEKPPGSYRIFCLGESTTFGHPYGDEESYVGFLRAALAQIGPEREWEVINCGGISYASYRLAVLAEELKRYQPDLLIVYVGHNEFLEERSFRDVRKRSETTNRLLDLFSHTRIATVLSGQSRMEPREVDPLLHFEVDTILDHSLGPKDYHRDPTLVENVVRQYRESLELLCREAESCGARLIFVDPADNLRFSPFKSEYGEISFGERHRVEALLSEARQEIAERDFDAAISLLRESVALDPLFADSQYLLGTALLESGQFAEARSAFLSARDADVCPLRGITALHEALREVIGERGISLVDFPAMIQDYTQSLTGHPIAGPEAFLDHVHPKPELHAELAVELLKVMRDELHVALPGNEAIQRNVEDVLATRLSSLGSAEHGSALCTLAQVLSWAGKDAEALLLAQQATEVLPDHAATLCQYGRLLEKTGQHDEARKIYASAVILDPDDPLATFRLGRVLFENGEYYDAYLLLKHSLNHTPERAPRSFRINLYTTLGMCAQKLDQEGEARILFRRVADITGANSANADPQ